MDLPEGDKLCEPAKETSRRQDLDFLRGVAIVLVLLRHQPICKPLENIGWIGVQLFFVLSGYLVSNLLFQEWRKFGGINPLRFLIRRGFKIYPSYYLIYALNLGVLNRGAVIRNPKAILSELFFLQNYVVGFGYTFPVGWSLAIEEHFYLLLAFSLWLAASYRLISFEERPAQFKPDRFQLTLLSLMLACLVMRILTDGPYNQFRYTMTHLRLDSLLAGVFVAYSLSFENSKLKTVFEGHKRLFVVLAFLSVCWSPFIKLAGSNFLQTIGLTLVYFAAAITLLYCLLTPNIDQQMNRAFSRPVTRLMSRVGVGSYAIYLLHWLVNSVFERLCFTPHPENYLPVVRFVMTSLVTIPLGLIVTSTFEAYFLRLRNRLYPAVSVAVKPISS